MLGVVHDSTSYVTAKSWQYNLSHGWVWDTDDFVVNMLGHPYDGSAYFATARTNGMSFWASAPLTFAHSAIWEYFGETTRPSINDILNTGFGGIALGEMFHRVAATIRDNQADGGGRVLREVAALPFDPVGSVNRLFRGEWTRIGPNPSEHNPVGTVLRMGGGAGIVRAPNTSITDLKGAELSSIVFADVKYGDSYVDTLRKPFDAFSMQLLLAPAHGGLTELVGVGRIAGSDLGGDENHRRQLEFNQRFEYVNNGALQFRGADPAGRGEHADAYRRHVLAANPRRGGCDRARRNQRARRRHGGTQLRFWTRHRCHPVGRLRAQHDSVYLSTVPAGVHAHDQWRRRGPCHSIYHTRRDDSDHRPALSLVIRSSYYLAYQPIRRRHAE